MTEENPIEVIIDKWVFGGDCMGRLPDGRVVFVPDTIPGEKVTIQIIEDKKGFARGVPLDIIELSANRITPKCEFFGTCIGCSYQHISHATELEAKTQIIHDQLTRIGKINNPKILPVLENANQWGYQTQATLIPNSDGVLCFSARNQRGYIPAENCPLLSPSISSHLNQLHFPELPDLAQVHIRNGNHDNDLLVLESYTDEPFDFEIDFPISVVQIGPEKTHIISDQFYQVEEFEKIPIRISAESEYIEQFELIKKISKEIADFLSISSDDQLIHIHAGIGLFSLQLLPLMRSLIAIENNSSEVEDFTFNFDNFDNVELFEATASQVLPTMPEESNKILVSPPESGINRYDLDAILAYRPSKFAYFSSNSSTLARDANRISQKGYFLESILPINLFPNTAKIHSLSYWLPI